MTFVKETSKKRQNQSGKGRRKDAVIGDVEEEVGGLITGQKPICVYKKTPEFDELRRFESEGFDDSVVGKLNN